MVLLITNMLVHLATHSHVMKYVCYNKHSSGKSNHIGKLVIKGFFTHWWGSQLHDLTNSSITDLIEDMVPITTARARLSHLSNTKQTSWVLTRLLFSLYLQFSCNRYVGHTVASERECFHLTTS